MIAAPCQLLAMIAVPFAEEIGKIVDLEERRHHRPGRLHRVGEPRGGACRVARHRA
jgi:hypothetical protein